MKNGMIFRMVARRGVVVQAILFCSAIVLCGTVCEKAAAVTSITPTGNQTGSQLSETGGFGSGYGGSANGQYTQTLYTYQGSTQETFNGTYTATADLSRVVGYTGTAPLSASFSGSATYEILSGSTVIDSVTATFSGLSAATASQTNAFNAIYPSGTVLGAATATNSETWTVPNGTYTVEMFGNISYTDGAGAATTFVDSPTDDGGSATPVPEPSGLCTTLLGLGVAYPLWRRKSKASRTR